MRTSNIKATFEVPIPQGADENGNAFTMESIEKAVSTLIGCPTEQESTVDVLHPTEPAIGHITKAAFDKEKSVITLEAVYFHGGFRETVDKTDEEGKYSITRFLGFALCE